MPITFKVARDVRENSIPLSSENLNLQYLTEFAGMPVEAAGSNCGSLVKNAVRGSGTLNGFVGAVHVAFDKHFALTLSPDDIWLAIANAFANHVTNNSKDLKDSFGFKTEVDENGKEKKLYIEIVRDHFTKGSPTNDWLGGFDEFSDKIAEVIGAKRDLLVSNFSTTGRIEKAASQIVLMDAMSSYIDYGCSTMCGIPKITLLGDVADWESIAVRTANLSEFKCQKWIDSLSPVLDQFVKAAKGNADPEFWNNFYKFANASGGPYVTGAINVFFPYLLSPNGPSSGYKKSVSATKENETCYTWEASLGSYFGGGPNPNEFPKGLSVVPFKWKYYGTEIPMAFLGGFIGASQDNEFSIRPAIGWGVAERKE